MFGEEIRPSESPPLIIPGLRGARRPHQYPQMQEISIRSPEEELEKSRLTLMRGDFEQPKIDGNVE